VREFATAMLQSAVPAEPTAATAAEELDLRASVQRYEVQVILEALRQANWNRTEAARLLQIPVRTLFHKIRQHGIKKLGFGVDGTDTGPGPK